MVLLPEVDSLRPAGGAVGPGGATRITVDLEVIAATQQVVITSVAGPGRALLPRRASRLLVAVAIIIAVGWVPEGFGPGSVCRALILLGLWAVAIPAPVAGVERRDHNEGGRRGRCAAMLRW